ncbi:MAG: DUF805 domain-containing protein [Clostridiales bacterium]|nr:DUF805 domain-containing protein [Clostridiales bacterium]
MPLNTMGRMFDVIDVDDFVEFGTDMFNWKTGQLQRWPFYICSACYTAVTITISMVIMLVGLKAKAAMPGESFFEIMNPMNIMKLNGPARICWLITLAIVTFINLSAFVRRLNDICLTKWIALVYTLPVAGFVLAWIISILPSGYGEQY